MSFSIGGGGGLRMGPRGAIHNFGEASEGGRAFDRRIIVRLLIFLKPHWKRMAVAFALMLVTSALTLAAPYLVKVAIDQPIAQGDAAGLTRISLLIAATFGALYVASAGQRYLLAWVGQRVLATFREQLFQHLQELSLGYHDTHIIGVTLSRIINDVAVINELLSQGLVTLIGDTLLLGGIVIVMLTMSPRLALVTFAALPLILLAIV
ncbi:MAG: ABC transporter transmembrane domain-containing protein, partial [Anaerolineae bacterium]